MRFLLLLACFPSILIARGDSHNNLYDRQQDKMEERMIIYYNRWFKYMRQHPECCCPCPPQECECEYYATPEERSMHFQD